MRDEKSLYGIIGLLIDSEEDRRKIAIKADKLADDAMEIYDFSSYTKEDLEKRYVKALTAVELYQRGYKSVVRGRGYYVNLENCNNPQYFAKFISNGEESKAQKEQALKAIQNMAVKNLPNYNQLALNLDDEKIDLNNLLEEISLDQLLEMLEKDAEEAN